MELNLPPKVRKIIYAFTTLGTPVIAYLNAKGYIGSVEVTLWSAEVTVAAALATYNTHIK